MITVRKKRRKPLITIAPLESPPAVVEDTALLFDEPINNLVIKIANSNGGMQYDFCKIEPHRSVRKLQEVGLVTVRKHTTRIWVVRLTADGRDYLGLTKLKRRRSRRRRNH